MQHVAIYNLAAGVLTKLDIMDKGTDALAMLHNDVLPLRLGYTAVVNRSQFDIQEKTPVTQARENEAKFFSENPQYSPVSTQCGIPALSKRCVFGVVALKAQSDHQALPLHRIVDRFS